MFKNYKITKLPPPQRSPASWRGKIVFLALIVLAVVFVARNYTLATTQGSSNTAKPTSGDTLRNGLVGWWTMDGQDVNATQALDKSGNNHPGTRTVVTAVPGKTGQAMNFNGSTSYIDITLGQTYVNRTVSFWFRTPRVDINNQVVFGDGSSWQGFALKSNGGLNYHDSTGGGPGTMQAGAGVLKANTWYNVVLTEDANAGGQFFINTTNSGFTSPTSSVSTTQASTITFGARTDHTQFFVGKIDDVRIYNRALSATEIQALYKYGQNKMASSQTAAPTSQNNLKNGLVGWWTMDGVDMTATLAKDKSGNGHDGTRTVVTPTGGKVGQAMQFAGATSAINATGVPVNTTAGGYNTVSLWMKWNGAVTKMLFDSGSYYDFYFSTASCIGFNRGQGDVYGFDPTGMNLSNKWVHVGLIFYNGDYTGKNKIYINGVEKTLTQCGGSTGSATFASDIYIGNWPVAGYNFGGLIDDVRIYSRALSVSEVQELYKSGQNKMASSQTAVPTSQNNLKTGLMGWWTFDGQDVNATQALDKSGSGNVGTRTATTIARGKIGQAMSFNGTSSIIDVGNHTSLINDNITMSVWVKARSIDVNSGIITNKIDANHGLNIQVGTSQQIAALVGSGSSFVYVKSASTFVINKWYHIAVTKK